MSALNIVPTITDATSPFDATAKADVILRSADLVDFAVLQYLLKLASPFFESLFNDASPEIVKDEKPVVCMDEDSRILRPLLLLCYPSSPPLFDDIDVLIEVISTASKFCMETEAFLGSLRHAVLISPAMQTSPERLFAIGSRHHWADVCKAAAKRSVAMEVDSALHRRTFGDELSHITAADLYVLTSYHREIADVVLRIAREIDSAYRSGSDSQLQVATFPKTVWFPSKDIPFPFSFFKDHTSGCKNVLLTRKIWVFDSSDPADTAVFTLDVPAFFYDYIVEVGSRFREKPSRDTILDPELFQKAIDTAIRDNSRCIKCRDDANNIIRRLHDWTYVFARIVEDMMKEVALNLNFS